VARLVVVALLASVLFVGCGDGFLGRQAPYPALPPERAAASVDSASGLPWIAVEDLPVTAQATLSLVEAGGPFPNPDDGRLFTDPDGLLPEPAEAYRVYRVAKPGQQTSPWYLVVGGSEEVYWTTDELESFRRVGR
jgi:ribonuclease T1